MASRSKRGRASLSRRGRPRGAPATDADHVHQLYQAIHAVVRRIPRGRVATYGQIALLAGIPGGARVVGAAMRASEPAMGLPWQRVVGKRSRTTARISILDPVGAATQRALLEAEGVLVSEAGSISLERHGWLPGDAGEAAPRARSRRK